MPSMTSKPMRRNTSATSSRINRGRLTASAADALVKKAGGRPATPAERRAFARFIAR